MIEFMVGLFVFLTLLVLLASLADDWERRDARRRNRR